MDIPGASDHRYTRDQNMPKKTQPRDLRVIDNWRKAIEKWSPLLPPLVMRLDGTRYLAIEHPRNDEEFVKAGYTEMRSWQRGPKTVDRPPGQWPKSEAEHLADGWVPAKAWHHEPFPLDIASAELADATIDLAALAKREGISAAPALWFARLLRARPPSVALIDQKAQVEVMLEEIQLNKNAKPTARALDDLDRRIVTKLQEARGKLVKSGDLYARSKATHQIGRDAFKVRLRRLHKEGWAERVGLSYRIGIKSGRPE